MATESNTSLLYLTKNGWGYDMLIGIFYLYAPFNFSNVFVYLSNQSALHNGSGTNWDLYIKK